MSRAVTLLTLDVGSVLYNPAQMPDEIVLKHTDGELVKARRSEPDDWRCAHREELEVNFWEDGRYSSSISAVATLADRQAFGLRVDGEPVNPFAIDETTMAAETIEIEGLDLGGIVVEDELQLPIAVYTAKEVYYRIILSEDDSNGGRLSKPTSVLEKREGPSGEWNELDQAEPTEAGYLLKTIAEETEMEAVSGTADKIRDAISDRQDLFKASRTREDEELREKMAIQDDTAFPPSTPKPRPVDFSE